MKKLLVAILAVGLLSLPAIAANDGGGKKKARKKAKMECKKDNTCEVKNCDPKNCDPKNCDPRVCPFPICVKEKDCSTATGCSGNK